MIDEETLLARINDVDADGDIIDLEDGRTLRVRIEYDDEDAFSHINGCDAYGKVGWSEHDRDTHFERRPAGFSGRAIKLSTDRGDSFWWDPYYDKSGGPYTPPSQAERQFMRDLVSFGFQQVGVELREKVTDSRGNAHTVISNSAWLGGIDTLDETDGAGTTTRRFGYLRSGILPDLVDEVLR